jgi:hypothetical protein
MRIFVEKIPVELALIQKGMTLKQLMESMETHLFQEGKVPTTLSINDHVLNQEEFEKRQFEKLQGNEILHMGAVTLIEFLANSLTNATEANQNLISLISRYAESVYTSTQVEDSQHVMNEFQHFFQFWQRLSALLPEELEELMCEQRPFHFLFEHLQDLHGEVVAAMDASEDVLAADILQYEMTPALESMHQSIPDLMEKVKKRAFVHSQG